MPTPTYDLISEQVLASAASSVTFTSIPQTYKDIVLEMVPIKSTTGGGTIRIQFNGDTGASYSTTNLYQENNTINTFRAASNTFIHGGFWNGSANGNTASFSVMSYSNTSVHKTTLMRSGNAVSIVGMNVGLWRSTAAVTSMLVYNDNGNFSAGSTFRLYGLVG